MEYYNNALCVSFEELTTGDPPIMAVGTLKSLRHRQRLIAASRGGGEGTIALFVYSSLPKRYRDKWEELYGKPEETMRNELLKAKVVMDDLARQHYEAYEYLLNGIPTRLKPELIEEYTLNASVIGSLLRIRERMEVETKMKGNPKRNLWQPLLDTSEAIREIYPHTLPPSMSRFKDKISKFKKEGYASLISKKVGNSNTLKLTIEAQELLIAMKRSRKPIYTDQQLFDEFNRRAEEKGWKPLKSIASLRNFLKRPDVEPLWLDAVMGEQVSRLKFDRRHRTELPTLRDALWYGDGTKLNLYYQDKKGKPSTLQVYEVIDAATEVMLGYHISETEDHWAQYHAFRMAIQLSGHRPFEIVTDNQGGQKKLSAQGLLSKIALRHRPTTPYNGRSKTIESLFGRFQSQILHKRWNFTGMNITATKATSRPNREFIEANASALPTRAELLKDYAECRNEWNNMVVGETGKTRMEIYLESVNPDTPAVSEYDLIDWFWLTTDKPSTFTASGIEVTINKVKRAYEVLDENGMPDLAWRRLHTNRRFYVQYDPADMGSVRLLTEDKRFERVAKPYISVPRAQQDQTAADKNFLREMQERVAQERVDRLVEAREIEQAHGTAPEQNGLLSPMPKGLPKEYQEQLDRRSKLYKIGQPKPQRVATRTQSLGEVMKSESNMDWLADYRPTADEVRAAARRKL